MRSRNAGKKLLLLMTCALLLTGCGKDRQPISVQRESTDAAEGEKKVLVLGTLDDSSEIRDVITEFNKNSTEYKVEIRLYGDNSGETTQALSLLQADIAAGKGPDILDIAKADTFSYVEKGLLTDLTPYLNADTEISEEDFLPNVLAIYNKDGMQTAIPSVFWIGSLVGKTENLDGYTHWNIAEYESFVNGLANPETVVQGIPRRQIFAQMMEQYASSFIDWDNRTCSFDGEEFQKLLSFVSRYPAVSTVMGQTEELAMVRNNQILLLPIVLNSVSGYLLQPAVFNGEVTYVGFPTERENGNTLMVFSGAYGIMESCTEKDAAWEVVKALCTADNLYLSDFPVYKENLNKAYAFAQTETYHLNDNGEKIADPLYRAAYGDETIEVYPATEEDIKKLQELLENAAAPDMRSEEVLNIIMEEAEPYLAGEKTAEEAAQVIQNRMQLYMSEK